MNNGKLFHTFGAGYFGISVPRGATQALVAAVLGKVGTKWTYTLIRILLDIDRLEVSMGKARKHLDGCGRDWTGQDRADGLVLNG